MDNFEATCKSSASRQIIILLVHLSNDEKKKADFVSIPCFALKYYYSFTVEGRKKHSLIPNF